MTSSEGSSISRNLDKTPTWAVACVCTVFILISIILERKVFTKWERALKFLGKLKYKNENDFVQDVKAKDLRQMFLAMTEEVRVIIVKLADRLHNMRTLSHMPPHKQTSIAMETLQVFAPLEKLLGMYQIKSELENLSFMYTNAEDHAKVKRRVADLFKEHEKKLLEANKILLKKIQDDQFFDALVLACPGLHKGYGRWWLQMSYGCYLTVWQPHVHISLPLCLAKFADSLESCRKGASVIRMLQSYLGAECFQFYYGN